MYSMIYWLGKKFRLRRITNAINFLNCVSSFMWVGVNYI